MKDHWIITKTPIVGFSIINITKLLFENKFNIHPKYWLRFFFGITISWLLAPFRVIQKVLFTRKIKKTEINVDPIFIIGLWRSGTTYLHTLLTLNKNYGYVSNIAAFMGQCILAFPKFSEWIVKKFLPEKRPFDNVKLNAFKPIEEEHCLFCSKTYSITHGFIFPQNFKRYAHFATLNVSKNDKHRWKKCYEQMIKKITLRHGGKQLILKNPSNTGRIKEILEMYPNAKFIHIHRNPYNVYTSTLKMQRKTRAIYGLQKWDEEEMKEDIAELFQEIYNRYKVDRKFIREEHYFEISYKKFLENPLKVLEQIHLKFSMEEYGEYKEIFQEYIDQQKSFKPNVYDIDEEIIERVNRNCSYAFEILNYERIK